MGDIASHVGIFDPALWTSAPLTFSQIHLPRLSPLPKVKGQYLQTVCAWLGEGGVLSCVGDHSLQDFKTQNLQNYFTTPNKNLGGEGGLRKVNTCRKVPIQVYAVCPFGFQFAHFNLFAFPCLFSICDFLRIFKLHLFLTNLLFILYWLLIYSDIIACILTCRIFFIVIGLVIFFPVIYRNTLFFWSFNIRTLDQLNCESSMNIIQV